MKCSWFLLFLFNISFVYGISLSWEEAKLIPNGEWRLLTKDYAELIKEAFIVSYDAYMDSAFPNEELKPVSGRGESWLGEIPLTLIDSLDSMMIFGLGTRLSRARSVIAALNFDRDVEVSVFETSLRVLGGLLSAYDLSGWNGYLVKARVVADRLLPAFFVSPSGIPHNYVNVRSGESHAAGWTGNLAILAEAGSLTMEFVTLSERTGDSIYGEVALKAQKALFNVQKLDGLAPNFIDPLNLTNIEEAYSFGGLGDSYYEYLAKFSLLTKNHFNFWSEFRNSIDGLYLHLLGMSSHGRWFLGTQRDGFFDSTMEHLACFLPATLLLNSTFASDAMLAMKLTQTCANVYLESEVGLFPDSVSFQARRGSYNDESDSLDPDWIPVDDNYRLRPETVESLFVSHQETGDRWFQYVGMRIFDSILTNCAVKRNKDELCGFSGIEDLHSETREFNDKQESFLLSETWKYLYLLLQPDIIDLNQFVFTSEAHPLRKYTPKLKYNVDF